MKKLKLNLQQLEGAEVLTRSQLKSIFGGDSGSGGCTLSACYKDSDCSVGYCKNVACTWDDGVQSSYNMCAPKGS